MTTQPAVANKTHQFNRLKWGVLLALILAFIATAIRAALYTPSANVGQPRLTSFQPLEGTKVRLGGTGTAGQELSVLINRQREERATVALDGTWSLDTTAFGQTGEYDIMVKTIDNASGASVPVAIVVDGSTIASVDAPGLANVVPRSTMPALGQATLVPTPPLSSSMSPVATVGNGALPAEQGGLLLFRPNVSQAAAGDLVQFVWDSSAENGLILQLRDAQNRLISTQAVPASASQSVVVQAEWGSFFTANLTNQGGDINSTERIDITCPIPWAIEPPPFSCPTEPAIESRATEQQFEGGRVIWVQTLDMIYILADNGQTWQQPDLYEHDLHPAFDESIVAPEGLQQPGWGIGKIWRENSDIRGALGWAVDVSNDYQARYQCSFTGDCYISTRDGGILLAGQDDSLRIETGRTLNLEESK